MKTAYALAMLFAVSAFHSNMASAEEWPLYRGKTGTGIAEAAIAVPDWSENAKVVWRVDTPLGFSSFSVSDGRAFTLVGEEDSAGALKETCIALDVATGKRLWARALGPVEYGNGGGNAGAEGNKGGDGPRSTPCTDGTHVYVYDSHLSLLCLSATSGDIVWKRDIAEEFEGRNIKWLNATSPLLMEDRVFVTGGGAGQSFLAFAKNSGELIWKSGDATMTHATPIIEEIHGESQLVFFMESGLHGISPQDGRELWNTEFEFRVSTAASPVVSGDQVYCSAGYGVGAGLFTVNKDGSVQEDWRRQNKLMNHWSTPVLKDGHLYGLFEFKKYGRGPLKCVELATGEVKWEQRGFGPGNCILVGDKLVVLSDFGDVIIASATTEGYKELARTHAVDGKCWSTPAYADGKIFIRSTTEAVCIDLE
ncbi:MAG: PQQ-binding-like beta-propeller repeat protein [Pirellulaceae bacterium]